MHVSVRRCGPFLFLLGLMLAGFAGSAAAQETGKIEGRVTSDAGQPLAGAQVVVLGTRLGNITNQDGYYFINNIPAGLQDVQAQYIGFQAVTVRQQRILAGQTTTLNFRLAQGAVAIEAIQVVGERAPLVPRDQTGSKNIVTGETLDQLPVDNTRRVVTLQPGVVESNRTKGVSIRGGRSGEEAVYVDGVLVRNYNQGASSGDRNLQVGTNALSEADVLTGGFSAQYGEAQSGIINYVTKTGAQRWTGSGSVQSDEMFPKKFSTGSNRAELSLGGPLLGGLSVFGAFTAQGNRYSNTGILYRDMPIYYNAGIDTVVSIPVGTAGDQQEVVIPKFAQYNGDGRVPLSNSDQYTVNGKLDYSYGSGSRVFLSVNTSRDQSRSLFGTGNTGGFYNPSDYSGTRAKNQAWLLGWTQNFVKSAEHALALDFKLGLTKDNYVSGVLNHDFEVNHRSPFAGFTFSDFRFMVEPDCKGLAGCTSFPVDQQLLDQLLNNVQTDKNTGRTSTPFGVDNTAINRTFQFRTNPYGVAGNLYSTSGTGGTFFDTEERDLQFRGSVDWQANRYNRVRFGGDYTDIDTRQASIGYNSLSFSGAYIEKPKRGSLFAQDRIDLGDLVIEAGVRLDRFDPNTVYPNIAGYYDPNDPSTFHKVGAQNAVSPRLGVSFPVTVNSTFRLSYGHFVQTPDLNQYFGGKNTDYFRFHNTNTNDIFGRPLQMPRTIAFEFGFRQLLGPDFVVDISAYNKDKRADVAQRKLAWPDPTNPGVINYLNTTTNADFGTIRGVDLRFDRRFSRILQGMLGYSYQDARNTGTDPNTYTNLYARIEGNANTILGLPPNPPNAMHVTEENRTHNITGTFNMTVPADESSVPAALRNVGMFGTFRFASGLPYSRITNVGDNIVVGPPTNIGNAGSLADQEVETARTPWIKQFDLRITRGLKIGRLNSQLFIDGRNVFDFQNKNQVFLTTGDITDQAVFSSITRGQQVTVSGTGAPRDVDLRSLSAAGKGVTNAVNLVALRRTEALFGNGDQIFTTAEQESAFMAATLNDTRIQNLVGTGRRFRLGIDFTF